MKKEISLVYNALAVGAKYLTSTSIEQEVSKKIEKVTEKKEKESLQHTAESIKEGEILAARSAWEKSVLELPKLREFKKEL